MDILILRIWTDLSFYFSVFAPAVISARPAVRAVLIGIPLIWAVWLLFHWKKRNMAEHVPEVFFLEVRLLLAAGAAQWMFLGTAEWKRQCVPFIISFAVAGIMLLRFQRLIGGRQGKGRFGRDNGKEFLVILALAGILASETVRRGFLKILGEGYRLFLLPVLELGVRALVAVLMGIASLLSAIFPGFGSISQMENQAEISIPEPITGISGAEKADTPAFFRILWVMAAVIVFFLFLRFLYRRFSRRGWERNEREAGEIRRSRTAPASEKIPWFSGLTGEKNVRYYYRRFLKLCMSRGIRVGRDASTSEEINDQAVSLWGMKKELSELRGIYLKIRYGEKEEEDRERRRARELYKQIKEKNQSES